MDMANAVADWGLLPGHYFGRPARPGKTGSASRGQTKPNLSSSFWLASFLNTGHGSLVTENEEASLAGTAPACLQMAIGARTPLRVQDPLSHLRLRPLHLMAVSRLLPLLAGLTPLPITARCVSSPSAAAASYSHPWFRALLVELMAVRAVLFNPENFVATRLLVVGIASPNQSTNAIHPCPMFWSS